MCDNNEALDLILGRKVNFIIYKLMVSLSPANINSCVTAIIYAANKKFRNTWWGKYFKPL